MHSNYFTFQEKLGVGEQMKETAQEENDLQKVIEQFAKEMKKEKSFTKSQIKILNAAMDLFSQKGYEKSSTLDIAKEAGVAEVTIFRNFKSKNNLLYQIIAPLIIQVASPTILRDIKKQFKDVENKSEYILTSIFKDRLGLIEKNEKAIQLLLREALSHEEILHSVIKNITVPAKKETLDFVKSKKETGEFRDVNEHAVTDLLFYSLLGYVISHHIFKIDTFTDDQDIMVETLVDLLLNGLKNQNCN